MDPELLGKHQMERIQPEKHLQPDPVLVDLLQRMKHYVTLGVLTNVGRGVAMRILATLGLAEDDFAVIMAAGDLEHPKPSTADLVRAVKAASGDVRYSVVVGDRAHVDIVPGLELGMETVLVPGRDDVVAWLRRELEHFEPGNRL